SSTAASTSPASASCSSASSLARIRSASSCARPRLSFVPLIPAPTPAKPVPPHPRSSVCGLPLDPAEDPVDETRRVLRRVPLGEDHSLVDRHLRGHRSPLELVDADAQDVALEGTEPVGAPRLGRSADALVERRRALR